MDTHARPAAIEERRTRVADLIRQQKSVRAIAALLEVSKSTIAGDSKAVRREWAERRDQTIDVWIAEELQRLAQAENAIWEQVIAGKLFAIDRLLAIMDRRAKYLGLDAPTTINVRDYLEARIRPLAVGAGLDADEMIRLAEAHLAGKH